MKPLTYLLLTLCVCSLPILHADTRSSTSYSLTTESFDAGGLRASSSSYVASQSLGGVTGTSSVAASAETLKQGYIAQLFDVSGLTLGASGNTVNENATLQISARSVLDDATFLSLSSAKVNWGISGGPLASVSTSGLVTAGQVYQTTASGITGSYLGFSSSLALSVLNVTSDDFGSYALDGLPDDWQVQYFGVGSSLAGPAKDPDGDGYNNLFEYTASLVPTDASSRFALQIQGVSGQVTQRQVIFSPRYSTSTYTIQTSSDLSTWSTLTTGSITDNGTKRTVIDTAATGTRKFYRVNVTKP